MRHSPPHKRKQPKRALALSDLGHTKTAVLNSLRSVSGQRTYDHAIREFVAWYCSEPRLAFNRTVVLRYRLHLEQRRYAPATINLRLAAIRRVAYEASDAGLLSADAPATLRTVRDQAMLALLVGCGLRRAELLDLQLGSLQQREEHWVIADLVGKAGRIRTVPVPAWVKTRVDQWTQAAGLQHGTVFRAINKTGRVWGTGTTPEVVWDLVRTAAQRTGIGQLAPHDLRRTCARLCYVSGGELEQIQFLLGHVSIQTPERYLGCKQKLRVAVNDHLGIEPGVA